jgi:hypothetical protein
MFSQMHQPVPKVLIQDLLFGGAQQLFWLLMMSINLDGGDFFRYSVAAFGGYWLGVLAIAIKRLRYQSPSDHYFIRFASLPLAILAIAMEPMIHHHTHWAFMHG